MKFKRIIIFTFLILTILLLFLSVVSADVWVKPYYRKDGTDVQGYYRSDPDSSPYNNISPTSQYDYININKSAGIFKIVDTQGNIIWYIDTTLLSISENEDNIVSSSTYIFKPIIIKKVGFSSVDDVMTAVAINNIGKVPNAPLITIGSYIEDVIKVMGTPESIQISVRSFKYRYSTVYFDDDWKVQSWDNRYGNLKVSLENQHCINVLDIDEYLIDDIFKITNDNLNKKSTILPTNKSVGETIKAFQEYLKNN
jgi:hypothetical protein